MKEISYSRFNKPLIQIIINTVVIFSINKFIAWTFPAPFDMIFMLLFLFCIGCYCFYTLRQLQYDSCEYFLKHPWGVKRPEKIYSFELGKFKDKGLSYEVHGALIDGILPIDLPDEIHVDGCVYKYTKQPDGVIYSSKKSAADFWGVHQSYSYIGKIEEVKPRQPLEIVEFNTGILNQHTWYYIRYNNRDEGGFFIQNLMEAIGYTMESQEADAFIKQLFNVKSNITFCSDGKHILYFDEREKAEAILEWLNSRYIIKTMLSD